MPNRIMKSIHEVRISFLVKGVVPHKFKIDLPTAKSLYMELLETGGTRLGESEFLQCIEKGDMRVFNMKLVNTWNPEDRRAKSFARWFIGE